LKSKASCFFSHEFSITKCFSGGFWGLRGCHLAPAPKEENALDPDDEDSRAVRAEMASRSGLGRRKTALESFLDADAWRIGLDRGVLGTLW
jgi:hypothetical protein